MTGLWLNQKQGRENDRLGYELAQSQSETKFVQYKYDTEKKYQEKANATDRNADARIDELSNNWMQYAAQSASRQPFVIQAGGSGAKGVDGPGKNTLIPITTEDGLVCAENTARLLEAHKWAIDLNK